ncbi:DeoR/GlpR family DNA-binding transcription regulator [Amaricoccus sp. W119]|uniref:DeoR/GlpR family DNA-binding transcription regulator n=1 Tax=Amaricoccus sp. W119 TaxID=3391833 RepID=UPI0039A78524
MMARHHAILDLARQFGKVTVEDLASRFDVTPQTIRKDLNDLCERKLLARIHGGAMISSGAENVGYDARRGFAAEGKAAIARAVAGLIPEYASVFIAIGTTTGAVAQELLQHRGLMVVTNDLVVANTMRPYPNIEVMLAGGHVRRSDGGIVGEAAVEFVRQYRLDHANIEVMLAGGHVRRSDGGIVGEAAVEFVRQYRLDHAVIGASAIDADGVLLDYDYREVKVTQEVLRGARNAILAADSTKFDRAAPVRVAELREVGTFVTDRCSSESVRRVAEEAGVGLIEAAPGTEVAA